MERKKEFSRFDTEMKFSLSLGCTKKRGKTEDYDSIYAGGPCFGINLYEKIIVSFNALEF